MNHIDYFIKKRRPLPGGILFDSLYPPREMILAANTRVTKEVVEGILSAAKDTENVVILQMALSEMDIKGGYSGLTPSAFAKRVSDAAKKVGWYGYVLHADHISVKTGSDSEMKKLKGEIDARIKAGFSSFAVDSSLLFDRKKDDVDGQLKDVLRTSIMLFKYLKKSKARYGKEGEVGEIGIKEFTEVPEAMHFLKSLKDEGIELNWLAIANGTRHGVTVDVNGKIVPKGINIKRTVEIANKISKKYKTRIAQHGTTGIPIELIEKFPKGKISKCNVGTFWMLVVWDVLKVFEPELYQRIYDWTIREYKCDASDDEIFAKNSKFAIKHFFKELENIDDVTKQAIRDRSYTEAMRFFRAFGMKRTAKKVYGYITKKKISY